MLQTIPNFDFKADDSCNNGKWKSWIRGFEIFAKANKIDDDDEKLHWMLHCAGQKVQNVYYTLPEIVVEKRRGPLANGYVPFQSSEYGEAVMKLQNFFEPKQNVLFERHVFRQMKQKQSERVDTFVIRLREQAERCDFEDQLESNIKDQITSGCTSNILRRKILAHCELELNDILVHARILEVVDQQQKLYETDGNSSLNASLFAGKMTTTSDTSTEVCKIDFKRKFGQRREQKDAENKFNGDCGRCGYRGHKANDEKCPAKGKECVKCGGLNHFARKCFSRSTKPGFTLKRKSEDPETSSVAKRIKNEVNMITQKVENKPDGDSDEDCFAIDAQSDVLEIDAQVFDNKLWCTVGDIEAQAVIDSGTRYNVVDRQTWAEWKAKNIVTIHRQKQVDIGFNAYGGTKLKFLGMFTAMIEIAGKRTIAKFYVADEAGKFLIGYETAYKLNVLKIANEVNQIEPVQSVQKLGKIKGVQIEIPLKPDAKGVVQPYRRMPVPLEKRVSEKINEMLERDIIERVSTKR